MGSPENENPSWPGFDDYSLIEDIPAPSILNPSVYASTIWPPPPPFHLSFSASTSLSVEDEGSLATSDGLKEIGSLKRKRSVACITSGSKACREKMRRDRLNDRFMELSSVLDPGSPPKADKTVILADALRMVTQLRGEAQKLKESRENLQKKMNELKAEKNELRDEKQRLKTAKENLERQVKGLTAQGSSFRHPPAIPVPLPLPGQVLGSKLVPSNGYPGVSMWQFMPPASFDTSHDHILRSPVA